MKRNARATAFVQVASPEEAYSTRGTTKNRGGKSCCSCLSARGERPSMRARCSTTAGDATAHERGRGHVWEEEGLTRGLSVGLVRAEGPVIVDEAGGRSASGAHGHGGGDAPPARSRGSQRFRAEQRKQRGVRVLLACLGVLRS